MAKPSYFDADQKLKNAKLVAEYLSEAFGTGTDKSITRAMFTVARAKGMSQLARQISLDRTSLYRSLKGNPKLSTTMKILNAFDMQLVVIPRKKAAA